MAGPDSALVLRSSKGLSVTNTMPLLGELVNPLIESPGNSTASVTPGCLSAISVIRRMTASVRSSEAASGSWAKATRYCLSCVGTKPVGILLKRPPVAARSPA